MYVHTQCVCVCVRVSECVCISVQRVMAYRLTALGQHVTSPHIGQSFTFAHASVCTFLTPAPIAAIMSFKRNVLAKAVCM